VRAHARAALWALCLIGWGQPAAAAYTPEVDSAATGQSPFYDGKARVTARLVLDVDRVEAGGHCTAGVLFDLDPGWHIYWAQPGDAGLATEMDWRSGDAEVGPIAWPKPETFVEADGITTYGYQNRVLLPVPVQVSDSVGRSLSLQVSVRYLACKVICSPGQVNLRRTLPVGAPTEPAELELRGLFAAASAAAVPVPKAAAAAANLTPVATPGATPSAPSAAPPAAGWADATGPGPAAAAAQEQAPPPHLLSILALALFGGLLLNLMPCVLPVLVLKVLGFAQHGGGSRKVVLQHGLAYTGGIVGTLTGLAGVVLGLRALGTQVGWGFQFQEPGFIAGMCTLLVLFALNCFGTYEILSGAGPLGSAVGRAHGRWRSTLEGALAVLLATPCSAPFLGSAVAYGLAASWWVTLSVFASVGIGLSLPLVILSLLPERLRWTPRPGAWMGWIKQGLGFGLLLTVVWLLWIFGRSVGIDAQAKLTAFLVGVGLLAWIYGKLIEDAPQRALGWGILFGAGIIGGLLGGVDLRAPEKTSADQTDATYADWSQAAVLEGGRAGRPVFVDFSADWCITCKFNENGVLRRASVQRAFARQNVLLLRADWTRRDESIRQVLQSFGRAGVPMYLLYDPSTPTGMPQILPELLTEASLLRALAALDHSQAH
jgi:thiol:disulfide interchange protein